MPLHLLSIDTPPALSLRLSLETVGIDGESFRCNSRFAINECHRLLHRAAFFFNDSNAVSALRGAG